MILYRSAPADLPFLWEVGGMQPPGRWHGPGDGPVQYLADTPDGAWAELVRHEEITDPADLAGVRRVLWAVEVPDDLVPSAPALGRATMIGDPRTYRACQAEAARLRAAGTDAIVAPSAALGDGEARGWRVEDGIRPGPPRDGRVIVLFGRRPDLVGWRAATEARPDPALVGKVRHLRRR